MHSIFHKLLKAFVCLNTNASSTILELVERLSFTVFNIFYYYKNYTIYFYASITPGSMTWLIHASFSIKMFKCLTIQLIPIQESIPAHSLSFWIFFLCSRIRGIHVDKLSISATIHAPRDPKRSRNEECSQRRLFIPRINRRSLPTQRDISRRHILMQNLLILVLSIFLFFLYLTIFTDSLKTPCIYRQAKISIG